MPASSDICHEKLDKQRNVMRRQRSEGSTSIHRGKGKERNALFNDELNTFYLRLYGAGHMVKERKEMLYLTTHSTHFIYGYMASDIW